MYFCAVFLSHVHATFWLGIEQCSNQRRNLVPVEWSRCMAPVSGACVMTIIAVDEMHYRLSHLFNFKETLLTPRYAGIAVFRKKTIFFESAHL